MEYGTYRIFILIYVYIFEFYPLLFPESIWSFLGNQPVHIYMALWDAGGGGYPGRMPGR